MEIKADAKLTGDVTPVLEGVGDNLKFIPNGAKALFSFIFGNGFSEKKRYQQLTMAQTQQDIELIKEGKASYIKGEVVLLESAEDKSIVDIFKNNKESEELSNVIGCFNSALEEIYGDNSNIIIDDFSKTFLNRWRNEAQFISEQELQSIWGKILAEEVLNSDSVNAKTLDILKYFTKEDANLFTKLCEYVVFNQSIVIETERDLPEIPYDFLEKMVDYGVLHPFQYGIGNYLDWLKTTIGESNDVRAYFVSYEDDYHIVAETDELVRVDIINLTYTGKELYRIAKSVTTTSLEGFCDYLLSLKAFKSVKFIHALKVTSTSSNEMTGAYYQSDKVFVKKNLLHNK